MQNYVNPNLTEQEGRAIWRAIRRDVNENRLFDSAVVRVLFKLAVLFLGFSLFLALSWLQTSIWMLVASYIGLALLSAQFAFIGHEAGHGAVSNIKTVNRLIGQISMTLVTGLAYDEWITRHRTHHRFCQNEALDPDMAVGLVISLTENSRLEKGALGRWLTRYQRIHVWFLSLLFGHSQRLLSQVAVLARPHRYPFDAVILVFHYGLWFAVPVFLLHTQFVLVLLAYLVPLTILGPYLAAIFWVNHVGMPLVRNIDEFSFLEHQSVTSRTIVNPPYLDWVFGGLNYQIEHHLFPQVPAHNLAILQGIVQKHFDHNGIVYNGSSWQDAVGEIAVHFRRVGAAR
jgi:fatty acid desaturase